MASTVPRPGIGVGVCVLSPDHPGCVLLGQRLAKTAAGTGTWAVPGGHLERGETWAACAAREVLEETGLTLARVRVGTVINVVDEASDYHYVVIFMVGDAAAGAVPANLEPDKCAGWEWHRWDGELPTPLFRTLRQVREDGFDPFARAQLGTLLQDADARWPPYCCCILHEASTGALLLEERGAEARVAAGQLTCFGGKRERDEEPYSCVVRELREELGLGAQAQAQAGREAGTAGAEAQTADGGGGKRARTVATQLLGARPTRAVDLYVDGELIAWFYVAPAPPRDAVLTFEAGRSGVWLEAGDDQGRVSAWHRQVLAAWRRGERRCDFETPAPSQ